jgi:acetyl-CoA carboxylase biotin carboxyl carrier protein
MDYNDIKNLINDIGKSNVDEVNLEFPDGIKISVKKNNQVVKEVCKENVSKIIENKETVAIAKENTDNYKTIKSPMVGTFYTKSEPTAKPYVKVDE